MIPRLFRKRRPLLRPLCRTLSTSKVKADLETRRAMTLQRDQKKAVKRTLLAPRCFVVTHMSTRDVGLQYQTSRI